MTAVVIYSPWLLCHYTILYYTAHHSLIIDPFEPNFVLPFGGTDICDMCVAFVGHYYIYIYILSNNNISIY